MFDRASLKLGLDKAVLQSMLHKDNSQQLSRKEVEDLLRRGAYGAIMDEDNEGQKFSEEDIETILQRRTQTIKLEPGVKGSTFAKASFTASNNIDIDVDDPNFWSNWAKRANLDIESAKDTDKNLIMSEPRTRRKRFNDYNNSESVDDADATDEQGAPRGSESKARGLPKKRRRGARSFDDDDDTADSFVPPPDELAFTKSDYFKVINN
jgi:hypothetical protein